MTDAPPLNPVTLSCLQVWGGIDPVDAAVSLPGMDAWVYSVPFGNSASGGDIHFVSSCGSGRVYRMMIADVAGHGAGVSEIARVLRDLMSRYMNHIDPTKFLIQMNQQFMRLSESKQFATAVVGTYYAPTRTLSITNAGHPSPFLYRARSKSWITLEEQIQVEGVNNLPLGILEDTGYISFEVELAIGDLVLCHSDSLIESRLRDGSWLGSSRLIRLLESVDISDPAHVIHHLLAKLAVEGAVIQDDATLLLFRVTGKRAQARFLGRVAGQLRLMGSVFTGRPIAWPEISVRNIGGFLLPGLARGGSRKPRREG